MKKLFLLLQIGRKYAGIIGWPGKNRFLAPRHSHRPQPSAAQAQPHLIQEMEKASIALQCAGSLLFVPDSLARHDALWRRLGYEPRTMPAWACWRGRKAAEESTRPA